MVSFFPNGNYDPDFIFNSLLLDDENEIPLLAAVSCFIRRTRNRINGFMQETVPLYSQSEGAFHSKKFSKISGGNRMEQIFSRKEFRNLAQPFQCSRKVEISVLSKILVFHQNLPVGLFSSLLAYSLEEKKTKFRLQILRNPSLHEAI